MKKLFFALSPDAATRGKMAKLNLAASGVGGRMVAAENLHLTLHFIGMSDRYECMVRQARLIRIPRFSITLDNVGVFRRARVFWVAPEEAAPELESLAMATADVAQRCGSAGDIRPYKPHCTLRRKISGAVNSQSFTPVTWPVRAFHLFESLSTPEGVRYIRLRGFPLRDT